MNIEDTAALDLLLEMRRDYPAIFNSFDLGNVLLVVEKASQLVEQPSKDPDD